MEGSAMLASVSKGNIVRKSKKSTALVEEELRLQAKERVSLRLERLSLLETLAVLGVMELPAFRGPWVLRQVRPQAAGAKSKKKGKSRLSARGRRNISRAARNRWAKWRLKNRK